MFEEHVIPPAMLAILTDGEMDEDDMNMLVTSVDGINCLHEEELYFAIGSSSNIVELLGCPSRVGLLKLAYEMGVFTVTSPSIIIKATIHNPENLPYDVPLTKSVIVLFADHTMRIFHAMYNAIKFIEDCMIEYDQCDITDFAILIGDQIEFDDTEWDAIVQEGGYSTR